MKQSYTIENQRINFIYDLGTGFFKISDTTNTVNVGCDSLIEFLTRSDFLASLGFKLIT